MKIKNYSFLFFYLVITTIISHNLFAQKATDSTLLYYKSITELNNINVTGSAFDFFNRKAKVALSQNDTIKAAYYLELIALGQFKLGFHYKSESTTIKALSLLDAMKNTVNLMAPKKRLSNQLGMIYRKLQDYNNSNTYYTKALSFNRSLPGEIAIITNIANNYADQKNYEKAVLILSEHFDKALTLDDTSIKAVFLDNLGYYESKIDKPTALNNMESALQIKLRNNDLTRLFSSYRHLSLYYAEKGDRHKALYYVHEMKLLSNKITSPIYQLESLKMKLSLENNSDFKKYLEFQEAIEKRNLSRENKFAAIQYNVAQKEKLLKEKAHTLEISELEKERQKNLKLFNLSLGILIALISVFTIVFLKTKHKKDKVQQIYITETRISKKVHDEVANDIYQVITKLQKHLNINEDILDDLENIYAKTRDISKENSSIEIQENYGNFLKDLHLSYSNAKVNIITKNLNKIDWASIDSIKKITLYRVIQELLVNMKKHSQATNVLLAFSQTQNKITIAYTDNGIGCNLKKGSGLLNMENRIKSNNGTITFESENNKGFKAKITI